VVVVGMLHRRVPSIAASIAMVAGILLISLGYFVPGFDAALKAANIHEFHFISIVFALLVGFMLVMGAVAPRREAWVLVATNDIDLTPWKGAKYVSGLLVMLVIAVYVAFAK
jgi:SSS family solute:Na+ symporter